MSDNETPIYWPQVKAILDGLMERWIERHGRDPYPGIHEYWWGARCCPTPWSCSSASRSTSTRPNYQVSILLRTASSPPVGED